MNQIGPNGDCGRDESLTQEGIVLFGNGVEP